jgi:uncharacterized protein involved in outer membrane biogenesis
VAVLGLVAFVALYAFTFTDRFRDFARREVLEAIRGSFRGQITVERLDGSVWGDLQLANVSLQYGGVEVVRVPHARLRYQLLPLLHGELRFTDVEVDEPVVDLHRDEKGSWNLGAALSTPPLIATAVRPGCGAAWPRRAGGGGGGVAGEPGPLPG